MTDLHDRFAQLDDLETEDLWREIELRYEDDVERVIRPVERPRRKLTVAAAAAFLLAVLLGAAILISQFQEEEPPIITQVPTPTSLPAPTSTVPGTATTLPAISLGDMLDWSLVPVLSEIDVECAEVYGQLEELCLTPYGTVLRDVINIDGRLWAVGHDGSMGNWEGMILSSADGETWNRVTDPEGLFGGPGDQDILAIAASDERLVAVGSTDCSAVGVDYPSSTETPFKTNPLQRCPQVWISQDGIAWEVLDSDAIKVLDGRPFRELLADAPFAPDPSFEARGYEIRDVTWTGMQFVAVGEAIWTSEDGRIWTAAPIPSTSIAGAAGECSPECRAYSILVTANGLVAVGRDPSLEASPQGGKASIWLSQNAHAWTQIQVDLPAYSELSAAAETPSGFILGGGKGDQALAMNNTDPTGWAIEGSIVMSGGNLLSDLAAGAPGEIAVKGAGHANDIVVDGDRIVIVGNRINSAFLLEGGAARVWGSLDGGSTWELYPSEDYSLFGVYTSSTTGAEMTAATIFDDQVIGVGWFNTNAAVWIGTWTD